MDNENISSETLPGDGDVDSSDGKETGSAVSVKDILGQTLNKQFNSDGSALKYVSDNLAYVGKARNYQPLIEKLEGRFGNQSEVSKAMEQILNQQPETVDSSKFAPREEVDALRNEVWDTKHPELVPYKDIISDAAKARGISLDEAVKLDSVKGIIEKASGYDKIENSKSVLQTNSRLGQVSDKMNQAQTSLKEGNDTAAKASAVSAVLEAYKI